MLLSQLIGPLRIAFQIHIVRIAFQACQGEYLVHHLEDQHILPEREPVGDAGFGQAVVAYLLDVQVRIVFPVISGL
jgi:hypothetical protein